MVNYRGLSYSELLDELKLDISFSVKNDLVLYKGMADRKSMPDYFHVDPSIGIRPSKTVKENGNIYNLLLNNLSNWKRLPKREKSIITTSNIRTAESYSLPLKSKGLRFGKTYIVVPKQNSKLVIAPKNDILYSFSEALKEFKLRGRAVSLVQFNLLLSELIESARVLPGYDFDWKIFKACIRNLSYGRIEPQTKISMESENILLVLKKNKERIIGYFDEVFSPEKNYFEVQKYNLSLMRKSYHDHEIWTDSACYLIERTKYNSIVKELM